MVPLAAEKKIVHNRALICSLIAQLVERRTVNPQVPGSSPGRGAIITLVLENNELRHFGEAHFFVQNSV